MRVADVVLERERVAGELRRRVGLSVPDPQANFVWLPAGRQAAELAVALEHAGLVTRPFPGEGVRVTIGTPSDDDRVLDTVEALAGPLGLADAWLLPVGAAARQVHVVVDRIDLGVVGPQQVSPKLQVVGRIGEHEVAGPRRELLQLLEAIA